MELQEEAELQAARIPKPEDVLKLFPDAEIEHVQRLLDGYRTTFDPVGFTCNHLLENGYPKVAKKENRPPAPATPHKEAIDYYREYNSPTSDKYREDCKNLLMQKFRRISVADIRFAMRKFNYHYAPTLKLLQKVVDDNQKAFTGRDASTLYISFGTPGKNLIQLPYKIRVLKLGRSSVALAPLQYLDKELLQEVEFVQRDEKAKQSMRDLEVATALNEEEYQAAGQGIECGCCFGEFPFDNMVQCYEGHLFCQTCLHSYAKEAVYGAGKAVLGCMGDGCDATYPANQLEKALTPKLLAKYEERVKEESINLADLEDLVKCPHCDFAALLDPGDKVFRCQNISCLKETCRYCKEAWKDHFGIPCSEIEKEGQTKLRVSYEERMTTAQVRTCHRCKASFTKSEGCNKMTCRCRATMCYICRQPNIDYHHFCNHPRQPGCTCTTCTKCSLWTNPEEDDKRAVEEIRQEMERDNGIKAQKRTNATSDDGPASKQRRSAPGVAAGPREPAPAPAPPPVAVQAPPRPAAPRPAAGYPPIPMPFPAAVLPVPAGRPQPWQPWQPPPQLPPPVRMGAAGPPEEVIEIHENGYGPGNRQPPLHHLGHRLNHLHNPVRLRTRPVQPDVVPLDPRPHLPQHNPRHGQPNLMQPTAAHPPFFYVPP